MRFKLISIVGTRPGLSGFEVLGKAALSLIAVAEPVAVNQIVQ
jgi:hypothetical protein